MLFIDRLNAVHINNIITTILGPLEGESIVNIMCQVEPVLIEKAG